MGIGFTGGLDQSDILSDGTPFDGSNIDASISSVGGVGWSQKTPKTTSVVDETPSSNGNYTIISVSGSGYIFAAWVGNSSNNGNSAELLIDGTVMDRNELRASPDASAPRVHTEYDGSSIISAYAVYDGIFRFDSSFELRIDVNFTGVTMAGGVDYALD